MKSILIRALLCLQIISVIAYFIEFAIENLGLRDQPLPWELHEVIEIASFLGLLIGMVATLSVLKTTMRRNKKVEDQLMLAAGEFNKLVTDKFEAWNLSPAERDVALLAIKGLSNLEIADVLEKKEGTVKAQITAVFRKADVSGRTQLVSSLVEDLISGAIERKTPQYA